MLLLMCVTIRKTNHWTGKRWEMTWFHSTDEIDIKQAPTSGQDDIDTSSNAEERVKANNLRTIKSRKQRRNRKIEIINIKRGILDCGW